ncbi:MAG: hypothetical protein GY803_02985 [Chloroflexi bacterium]|nr:hypothetical protein [Chloroflexota bacterium]
MPVELIYLLVAALLAVALVIFLLRRLWRRSVLLPPDLAEDSSASDRFLWITRLQIWLLSPPGSTSGSETAHDASLDKADESSFPGALPLAHARLTVAAAFLGGGLIVAAGLVVKTDLPSIESALFWGLMGVGGIFFFAAGRLANQRLLPAWVARPVQFLDVSAGQLILLALAPCFALLAYLAAGDLLQARHSVMATLLWLLAAALVILGSWPLGKERLPRIARKEWAFTAVVLIIAVLLRGTNLAGIPNTLSGDEAASGLLALDFRNGKADNLFTFGWYAFPSFYFPIQGLGIRFWGETTEALRITSAVGGALAAVAGYWLARVLFDRLTGVMTAVYLAASHYHIHMSRIGLNNIWDSLFGSLAIMGLWHGWKTGRRISFVLAGVALGLGQYFYVSMRALPIIFLAWAGVAFWREPDRFRRRLPGLILAAFIAFVLVLPFGAQAARAPDNFVAPYNRVSIFAQGWLDQEIARTEQTAGQIIRGQMLTTALGFTHQPLRLLYAPGAPLLRGGAATLFLMGLLWALLHFDLKYLLIFLPMLFVVVTGGYSHNPPASQRFVMVMPLVALTLTLPLRLAVGWLQRLWPQARAGILLGVGLILAAIVWGDLHYYFFEAYDSYVLGGDNTETATEIAHYLRDHEIPEQKVYFFGFPRMGYFSLATIPYLAPKMEGEDIVESLTSPPDWELAGPTLFIFLPERLNELEMVRESYPDGRYREFFSAKDNRLFFAYEVESVQ